MAVMSVDKKVVLKTTLSICYRRTLFLAVAAIRFKKQCVENASIENIRQLDSKKDLLKKHS